MIGYRTRGGEVVRFGWFVLLAGCPAVSVDEFEACSLDLVPASTTLAVGAEVTLSGGPFSEVRDTRVSIGGVDAPVVAVTRENCTPCDNCREVAGCTACGACLGLDLEPADRRSCFGDPFEGTLGSCGECVQSMTFAVPADAPLGETTLWVLNRHGSSEPLPVTVTAGPTTTTGGSGR